MYFTEACEIQHEYYLALVLDRETAQTVVIASTEGGMDIEEVAESSPEKLSAFRFPPQWVCDTTIADGSPLLGFTGEQVKQLPASLPDFKLYWENNAMLVEINLITTDRATPWHWMQNDLRRQRHLPTPRNPTT